MIQEHHLKPGDEVKVPHPFVPGKRVLGRISSDPDSNSDGSYGVELLPSDDPTIPTVTAGESYNYTDSEIELVGAETPGPVESRECMQCGSELLHQSVKVYEGDSKAYSSCTNAECSGCDRKELARLLEATAHADIAAFTELDQGYTAPGTHPSASHSREGDPGDNRKSYTFADEEDEEEDEGTSPIDEFLEPPEEEDIKRMIVGELVKIPGAVSKARAVVDRYGANLPSDGDQVTRALDNIIAQVDSLRGLLQPDEDEDLDIFHGYNSGIGVARPHT